MSATKVEFSEKPASVEIRENGEIKSRLLSEVVRERCPSLWKAFRPAAFLSNRHLQTLYNVLGDFTKVDRVWYRRTFLRFKDGGTVSLDFFQRGDSPIDELVPNNTPMIIVEAGLTGASYEPYIRAVLSKACAPVKVGGLGYQAVCINSRGCGGAHLTTPHLRTVVETSDLRQALTYISHKYPSAPLLGLGFSAGANLLLRYIAEDGDNSRLSAMCGLCCPWNLRDNSRMLHINKFHRRLYARALGSNYQHYFTKHASILTDGPNVPPEVKSAVHAALALRKAHLRDIDDIVWSKVGHDNPPFPFNDVDKYYLWGSSDHVLKDVNVPCLVVNAEDDPLVRKLPKQSDQNPMVVKVLTKKGGHLGWFTRSKISKSGPERWSTQLVLEWLKFVGEDLHFKGGNGLPVYKDEQGFFREEGRENALGCKEVPGSEHIVDACLENIREEAWRKL